MGKLKNYAIYFIIAAILVIAAFDAWLIIEGDLESSISATLIEWGYKYPIFTFLMGVTMGHLFWRMRETPGTKKQDDYLNSQH